MKKLISFLLVFLFVRSQTAFAMPDPNLRSITVIVSGITDESAYIDLLVNIEDVDTYYTEYNSLNMSDCKFDTTELKEYSENRYISFSCHHKEALTDMRIRDNMTFCSADIANTLKNERKRLRLAVLDKQGQIIQVSDTVILEDDDQFLCGDIKYNVQNNKVNPDMYKHPDYTPLVVFFASLVIIIVVLLLYLFVHSLFLIGRKPVYDNNDGIIRVSNNKKIIQSTWFLTAMFVIGAVVQGFANILDVGLILLVFTWVIIPLVLTVITVIITQNALKIIIPDIVYICIIIRFFGDLSGYIIFAVIIMLAVQVIVMTVAVIIRKRKSKIAIQTGRADT